MGKADYMQAYPLPERCLGGSLRGSDRVAVSSGSTGQPTFWPRSVCMSWTWPCVSNRYFATVSALMNAARWLWFVSLWATGWAACIRRPAAGIWHTKVIR